MVEDSSGFTKVTRFGLDGCDSLEKEPEIDEGVVLKFAVFITGCKGP